MMISPSFRVSDSEWTMAESMIIELVFVFVLVKLVESSLDINQREMS